MRGRLIVLEGIDKAGKETQGKMLLDFFAVEGIKAVYFEQPSSNNIIGRTIKKFLNMELEIESGEAVALLYTADRHEQLKKEIIPALKKGKFVILDRYYYSTIAYQNVLYKVNESWIRALNALVPTPDVVILLDIDPETSVERTAKMGESDRHQRRLRL
jgi:dTMP kinase